MLAWTCCGVRGVCASGNGCADPSFAEMFATVGLLHLFCFMGVVTSGAIRKSHSKTGF